MRFFWLCFSILNVVAVFYFRRNRANSHRVRLEKDVHATKPQVVGDKHLGMACIWCYNLPKITVNSP